MKMRRSFENGLSLIETIVAIGVLVVGISGSILLTNNSINTMTFSRHLFEGNQFAAEGIEIARAVRDSNWLKNIAWDSDLSEGVYRIEFDPVLNTMKLASISNTDAFDVNNLQTTLKNKTSIFHDPDVDRPHFTQDETKGLSETVFHRQVEITDVGSAKIIRSIVVIPRGAEYRVIEVEEELYNWKQ